ncbi:hypothetical protein [Xanthomonas hortorum]|uniref:Uncharacterized protein n=1 Tax=Xanthomonas hortorum pv. hederae TaxID=453603 RepID=A0A9X4BVY3_9XANT|nr:hypothetical protein [Xanthomonas hortorum]MCE4373678.1 hypothetical protein [Xanthomonas hortorum pv. hederae]MDC8640609.1 hypothetical protein [Xanthomonas hortorum pv. hederae]
MKVNKAQDGKPKQLKAAIRRTIYLTLILAGAASVLSPLASASDTEGTTTMPPVEVPPPYIPPPIENPPPPYYPDPGDGGGGDGGGGGGDNGDPEVVCNNLRNQKPQMCPNPIPLPAGATYAQDKLPGASINGKSTILMAIGYSQGRAFGPNGTTAAPNETAAWLMDFILNKQTENFAKIGLPLKEATKIFREDVKAVCDYESMESDKYRIVGQQTVPEYYCFEIMKALDIEADDQMSFVQFFIDWAKRYAVNLERYIPGEALSSGSLDNSIGTKWRVTTADAACSRWWTTFQENQCSL